MADYTYPRVGCLEVFPPSMLNISLCHLAMPPSQWQSPVIACAVRYLNAHVGAYKLPSRRQGSCDTTAILLFPVPGTVTCE
jgi:hypothetical protein